MLTYLLQTSTCLIILYGIYHFILAELTFFKYNRAYLLLSMLVSLLIPLLAPLLVLQEESVPVLHWSHLAGNITYIVADSEVKAFDWKGLMGSLLWAFYIVGVVVVLLKMIYGLSKIFRYYRHGQKEDFNEYRIITTEAVHLPFSFFKAIYVSRHVPLQDHIHTILEHEEIHIRQWHTLDVLMAEMVHAFFWFNPVMIFYKRALRQAHEYLADDLICSKNSVSSYTELLLSKSQSGLELALTNQFFHSQIKKRIQMMTTHKTNRGAAWKYALVLPLLMGLVVLFSSSSIKEKPVVVKVIDIDSIPAPQIPSKNRHGVGIKNININKNKAIVQLTNGKTEKYDLNNSREKDAFQSKYGDLPIPPPPAPATTSKIAPPAPPVTPAPPNFRQINLTPPDAPSPPPPPPAPKKNLDVYREVDEMPRFPGCEHLVDQIEKENCSRNKLLEFIAANIKYPAEARKNSIQGNVVVEFIVDEKGYINGLKLLNDIGGGCGDEVLRVITSMNGMPERWAPGKIKDKNINTVYILPVKFALEKSGK